MLEILLGSSLLIVVLALLRLALRGRIRARLQYALWLLVLARLLVPVTLFDAPEPVSGAVEPVARRIESGLGLSYDRTADLDYPSEAAVAAPAETVRRPAGTAGILRAVWYGGMALTGLWFCYVNLRMARRLRKGRRKYPVDAPVSVYVAPGAPGPCLFGLFRPAIYLTEQAVSDAEQARQIVVHERMHLCHGDCVWALLRGVCLVIWWFDPLVWLAAALSRRDCELACDEATVRALGEERRYDYGRTLLGMAAARAGASELLCGATTMSGGRRALAERIRAIARPKNSVALCAAALALALLAGGCAFAGTREAAGKSAEKADEEIMSEETMSAEEEMPLGRFSDELMRLYDELGAFSSAAEVRLDCESETAAAAYRAAAEPDWLLSFGDVVYCTDSWTAEYGVSLPEGEPSACVTIVNAAGDELYVRDDADSLYVRRADGRVDRYTGPDGRFLLEGLWYWAAAMSAPAAGAPVEIAAGGEIPLSELIPAAGAAYWYCSDYALARLADGDGAAAHPRIENGRLLTQSAGSSLIACADAEGRGLGTRLVVIRGAESGPDGSGGDAAAALAPFAQPVSVEVYPAGYTLPADAPYMDLAAFINAPPGWEYVPAGAEAAAETARGDVRGLHITGTDGELWIYDDTDWIRIRSAAGDICVSCGHSGTEMLDWLWRWALETAAQPEG